MFNFYSDNQQRNLKGTSCVKCVSGGACKSHKFIK